MALQIGNDGDGDDELMLDINTTPLIDVMLVLLIMFIITIPMQTHAVKMAMPAERQAPPPTPPEVIRIDVDFDGAMRWNGEPVADRTALEARLSAVAARSAQADAPELHLHPNKLVAYKSVAMILAEAQRLGVTRIGLIEDPVAAD